MVASGMCRAVLLAGTLSAAGCALEEPSQVYHWRGQYSIEASTCAFLDGAFRLRLHEDEPGQISLYTPFLPDGWSAVDSVKLEASGDDRLAGSAVGMACDVCSDCTRSITYARDDIQMSPSKMIHVELARASQAATETTCNEQSARALAASAVTCTVDATYVAADVVD